LISGGTISELTDIQLLKNLCSSKDDAELYEEFVNRFNKELVEECKRICSARQLHDHIGIEIANTVFERVRKYKSFKANWLKHPDPHKAILIYLFRFCINLFNDHHKKEERNKSIPDFKCYFENLYISTAEEKDVETLKGKKERSISIINKLNYKERKVILADFEYKKFQPYLPDDICERLAEELGVEVATIRKIRQRAIAKINKAINEPFQK
jgi:DNA-directed RNA polymerase specialized sigma24 family protein